MTKWNEFNITSCAIEEISDSAKHNILRLRENKIRRKFLFLRLLSISD